MTITFPIEFPAITEVMEVIWRAVRADIMSQSPTTFVQQIIRHQGQRWEADIILLPTSRADASAWLGFLLSLDGRAGTFLMTPPEASEPQGAIGGSPRVAGASQTGSTLSIDGCAASTTGWLKAGDFFQLGSGSAARLHAVVADADTDGAGAVTLDIWPQLRESPTDNSVVIVTGAKGRFRLEQPIADWSVSSAVTYGFAFSIVEAL